MSLPLRKCDAYFSLNLGLISLTLVMVGRSHIEMVKTFKVWAYREGEVPMVLIARIFMFIFCISSEQSKRRFGYHPPPFVYNYDRFALLVRLIHEIIKS